MLLITIDIQSEKKKITEQTQINSKKVWLWLDKSLLIDSNKQMLLDFLNRVRRDLRLYISLKKKTKSLKCLLH